MRLPAHHQSLLLPLDLEYFAVDNFEVTLAQVGVRSTLFEGAVEAGAVDVMLRYLALDDPSLDLGRGCADIDLIAVSKLLGHCVSLPVQVAVVFAYSAKQRSTSVAQPSGPSLHTSRI
jgi:hypothetical protein